MGSPLQSGAHWNAEAARQDDTGRKFWTLVSTMPLTLLTLAISSLHGGLPGSFAAGGLPPLFSHWRIVCSPSRISFRRWSVSWERPTRPRRSRSL
jgi:hypothetical protein